MTLPDSGYATVAVTALMSGLAIIALTVMNLSTQEARKAVKLSERLVTDMEIDGTFNQTVADLVNGNLVLTDSLTELSRPLGEVGVVVRISSEATKKNINTAATEEIHQALLSASLPKPLIEKTIQAINDRPQKPFLTIDELATRSDTNAACLREVLTVFRSTGVDTTAKTRAADGSVLRIQITAVDSLRSADGTVLLTGKRADPVWLMDWSRQTNSERYSCG